MNNHLGRSVSTSGNGQARPEYVRATGITHDPSAGLNLYLVFVISWFLHLGTRISFLGAIRFDLILVLILAFLAISKTRRAEGPALPIDKLLRILVVYSVITVPFVEWPGSVIRSGIPEF